MTTGRQEQEPARQRTESMVRIMMLMLALLLGVVFSINLHLLKIIRLLEGASQ